ncbi:MAG TPA: hypothetical protein VGH87_15995, partial [Polyangiaceae bacterium]
MSAAVSSGPGGFYGVRNLLRFTTLQLRWLRQMADEHGDIVPVKMLVKDARVMVRDRGIDIVRRVLGQGLLTSEGDLWKRQRKLMSQAFTPK